MDIDKLEGRELDALVAERRMGVDKEQEIDLAILDPKGVTESFRATIWANILPHYSTDIAAADLVIDKMEGVGFSFHMWSVVPSSDPPVYISYFGDRRKRATEFTRPLSICRAALKATESE